MLFYIVKVKINNILFLIIEMVDVEEKTLDGLFTLVEKCDCVDNIDQVQAIVNYFINLKNLERKFSSVMKELASHLKFEREDANESLLLKEKFLIHVLLYLSLGFFEDLKKSRGNLFGHGDVQKLNNEIRKTISDYEDDKIDGFQFAKIFCDTSIYFDNDTLLNFLDILKSKDKICLFFYMVAGQYYSFHLK